MLRRQTPAARRTGGHSCASSSTPNSPTVLLTGFDPFGGAVLNPSWLAACALQGRSIGGHRVIAAKLPTIFGRSLRELSVLLKQHRPALVLCLGLAGGRNALSLERVAINIKDARIADNAGDRPIDVAVVAGGPAAYFTSLPIKAMLQAMQRAGIAAEVSQTAGTFVCNQVFYGLMNELASRRALKHTRGGFMHLPFLPEQGTPSMDLDDMVRGLRIAIRCALRTGTDSSIASGALH